MRDILLDAAEMIMLEEGHAAVSSRKVASKAGQTSQLLHYYFRTMDDLFVAVFHRLEDRYDGRFARAVASDHPIQELWRLSLDLASTTLILEFNALATHRKAIRELIARSARRDRTLHAAALAQVMERRSLDLGEMTPITLALLMASVARTIVSERALGVSDGHAEMLALVERHLHLFESQPLQKKPRDQHPNREPTDRSPVSRRQTPPKNIRAKRTK